MKHAERIPNALNEMIVRMKMIAVERMLIPANDILKTKTASRAR